MRGASQGLTHRAAHRFAETEIPVFLDVHQVCEGHLVVLGMTRMGKTTLSRRIAQALAKEYRVTLIDQTGEYVRKRGLEKYDAKDEDSQGLSVFESALFGSQGKKDKSGVAADRCLDYLKWLVKKAAKEYSEGDPFKRVVILEEAHQFVPEPAGLGFGALAATAHMNSGH